MPSTIQLRVPRYELNLDIELLPDLAPSTVDALRAAMPYAGLVATERTYGATIGMRLPTFPGPMRPENATLFAVPGDVLLYEWTQGVELIIFFDRTLLPYDLCGAKTGNQVGAIVLTPELRNLIDSFWREGAAWGALGRPDSRELQSITDDWAAARREVEARFEAWHRRNWRDHRGPPAGRHPRVALVLPQLNVRTEVELAVDRAPESCENVLNHLPISLMLLHGRMSGPEMFTDSSELGKQWHWKASPENLIEYPIPGDMVLYYGFPQSNHLQLNWFYGRGSIPAGIPNPEPGNLLGRSVDDFGAFAQACWRIGYQGFQPMVVERVLGT